MHRLLTLLTAVVFIAVTSAGYAYTDKVMKSNHPSVFVQTLFRAVPCGAGFDIVLFDRRICTPPSPVGELTECDYERL